MDIKSMYLAEIEQWMKEHGQPAFRAKQVFQWMHQKYVASTEDMSNLPKALRAQMDEEGFVHIEAEMSQESKSDGTIKFLYRLSDGQMIETVFMRHNYGNSVCISGRLPDGLPFLCVDDWRTGTESDRVGDARTDLCDEPYHRRTYQPRGRDGNGRTARQL